MLKVYNTLTRTKEEFRPIEKGKVKFYQCGPTVYWTQHIGNLRGMAMADLIRRSLEYLGYDVDFVRNYTDVGHLTGDNLGDADTGEDRMERGAKREGKSPQEIAEKYIKIFEDDTKALNIFPPDHSPRATSYIQQIQDMVSILIDKGYAYVAPKAVYFDVSKVSDYNKLNRQNLAENRQGAGTGDVIDSNKRNPQDFALWFFKTGVHENALQTWESPWSTFGQDEGFPGWHIECSAMIKSLLGDTIDLHMGGVEHISIHHTNEIAQSESANGKPFVNYWIHNEHLMVDSRKMAKSEGTAYSLAEVVGKGYDPLALRYFFLQAHYRSKQNFTWEALEAARAALSRLKNQVLITNLQTGIVSSKGENYRGKFTEAEGENYRGKFTEAEGENYRGKFTEAVSDDFNIPQALAIVWEVAKSGLFSGDKRSLLIEFDKVLGLGFDEVSGTEGVMAPREVDTLVKLREKARIDKNWEEADKIREEIEKMGYEVMDSKDGRTVRRILGKPE